MASYRHARDVIAEHGDPVMAPWLALTTDGMLLAALVVIWVRRHHGEPGKTGPWAAFWAGMAVTIAANLAAAQSSPVGIEDCNAALNWLAEHADQLGVDGSRIGIGGVSAGGGLAAGTALLARDRGGPRLCFQFLDVPELDDRLDTPSMQAFIDTPLWNRPNAIESWRHYSAAGRPLDDVLAYAAPARATDVSGLPPTYVAVCEFDPLRDEGIAYAQRLVQSGVPTERHLYPGTFHGSSGLVPTAGLSRRMRAELIDATRRGLNSKTVQSGDRAVSARRAS